MTVFGNLFLVWEFILSMESFNFCSLEMILFYTIIHLTVGLLFFVNFGQRVTQLPKTFIAEMMVA